MPQEGKALVRRFIDEVQSQGNIDALDEFCAPDFVNYSAPPGMPSNCEGVKHVTAMFAKPSPTPTSLLRTWSQKGIRS